MYYRQLTPEQRRAKTPHLHTPPTKAKAQERATQAKRSYGHRVKQAHRRYNYLAQQLNRELVP